MHGSVIFVKGEAVVDMSGYLPVDEVARMEYGYAREVPSPRSAVHCALAGAQQATPKARLVRSFFMEDFWVNLSTKLGNNLRIEKMGNRLGEADSHFSIITVR